MISVVLTLRWLTWKSESNRNPLDRQLLLTSSFTSKVAIQHFMDETKCCTHIKATCLGRTGTFCHGENTKSQEKQRYNSIVLRHGQNDLGSLRQDVFREGCRNLGGFRGADAARQVIWRNKAKTLAVESKTIGGSRPSVATDAAS